ncbi:MAG: FAD binding domain-containing protein [Spirochaetaceae bacterium]|jgi:CO/xanthine dehydrogenase FAD-binding subunit|nr:FAD binding domain-containing protein [Spirochaetaceae bacterium]
MLSQIFYPNNLQEFFNTLDRFTSVDLFKGGAYQMRRQHGRTFVLPELIIDTDKLAELHSINRTERYLEVGSMVSLSRLLTLGKIVPEIVRQTLEHSYPCLLRNAVSIGGVLCGAQGHEPLNAALIALGARCELRANAQSRWVSLNQLTRSDKPFAFSPHEILYRVRIPLDTWNFSLLKNFDDVGVETGEHESGLIIFLARIQNDILSDVLVIFSGPAILQDRDCETGLIGQKLPLPKKDVPVFTNLWKNYFSENCTPFLRDKILAFIESAILQIAD